MNGPLNIAEAYLLVDQHLGDIPRAAHSRFVAHLMRQLAATFAADADLWEIVGLCHDLDFLQTSGDRSQHGLLTIRWLGDRIPVDAKNAIAAHDHRTGVQADTLLADMLKVADVIAVFDTKLGRPALCDVDRSDPFTALRNLLPDRPYLSDMLERYTSRHALPFARIIGIVAASQSQ
jgi:hypothetical protein